MSNSARYLAGSEVAGVEEEAMHFRMYSSLNKFTQRSRNERSIVVGLWLMGPEPVKRE